MSCSRGTSRSRSISRSRSTSRSRGSCRSRSRSALGEDSTNPVVDLDDSTTAELFGAKIGEHKETERESKETRSCHGMSREPPAQVCSLQAATDMGRTAVENQRRTAMTRSIGFHAD